MRRVIVMSQIRRREQQIRAALIGADHQVIIVTDPEDALGARLAFEAKVVVIDATLPSTLAVLNDMPYAHCVYTGPNVSNLIVARRSGIGLINVEDGDDTSGIAEAVADLMESEVHDKFLKP